MSLRDVAVAATLVALAIAHGLVAETLKIASPIRGSMKDAVQFKFLPAPLGADQLKELIQIVPAS
jgi:hypothetical protein